ncbi:MAG: DNA replication/repair protein RecF [Chloroflexi bacterium]|nr:DNA replication/repair protein RecF [Chloroflexota bacterium]
MYISHLSLTNFRSFSRLDIDVPRGAILLLGDNAQGKTSILEAIYFLSTFTSLQAGHHRELINFLAAREPLAVTRITADYQRENKKQRIEVRIIQEKNGNGDFRVRKEILLNGVQQKTQEAIGQFNTVLFLPHMLNIISGSPVERRRYLNLALSQTDQRYTAALSTYNKLVTQRNALLKSLWQNSSKDLTQLDYWDEQVAKTGATLIYARIQAVLEIEHLAALAHHELTRSKEVLRMVYLPAYDPDKKSSQQMSLPLNTPNERASFSEEEIADGFQEALLAVRQEEILRGVTTIGPHRDALHFLSNGIDLGAYGSRGQIRTALLALKIAEISWMKEKTGHWPVLLLDEVLAELDPNRRNDLLSRLGQLEQALLTTTDIDLFNQEFSQKATLWQINEGRVHEGTVS